METAFLKKRGFLTECYSTKAIDLNLVSPFRNIISDLRCLLFTGIN